jgi:hypothetical protein
MRRGLILLLGIPALVLLGCSNESGTSGPETMPVNLSVRVINALHGMAGATVIVANLQATTQDTSGLVTFHSDINTLIPNHTYKITVVGTGLIQASPDADTVRIPSAPNRSWGYDLETYVLMKAP